MYDDIDCMPLDSDVKAITVFLRYYHSAKTMNARLKSSHWNIVI